MTFPENRLQTGRISNRVRGSVVQGLACKPSHRAGLHPLGPPQGNRFRAQHHAIDDTAFGMSRVLLQQVTRDALRFAMTANAMKIDDGNWRDFSKKPANDPTKVSRAGRQV